MARYGDLDKLAVKWRLASPTQRQNFREIIESHPTADVVPKSEVDMYRKQVDELEDELASTYDKLEDAKSEYDNLKMQFDALDCECDRLEKAESEKYDKFIEAKAEVAREIFAEIEAIKCVGLLPSSWVTRFAELKKKYTDNKE